MTTKVRERLRKGNKLTTMRGIKTRMESQWSLSGRQKEGAMAPRPITLPPMPWDKKDDAAKRNDGG